MFLLVDENQRKFTALHQVTLQIYTSSNIGLIIILCDVALKLQIQQMSQMVIVQTQLIS